MSVLSLIQSTPELLALADAADVAGLVAALNARTIERTDATLRGPALVQLALGQEVAAAIAFALSLAEQQPQAIGAYYSDMRAVYRSSGFDLSNAATRAGIDSLVAAGLPVEVGEAIKGLGVWQISLYEQALGSRGVDVTAEEVQAALAERSRAALYARQAERYNALVAAMDAGTVNTDAEAAAFFEGA